MTALARLWLAWERLPAWGKVAVACAALASVLVALWLAGEVVAGVVGGLFGGGAAAAKKQAARTREVTRVDADYHEAIRDGDRRLQDEIDQAIADAMADGDDAREQAEDKAGSMTADALAAALAAAYANRKKARRRSRMARRRSALLVLACLGVAALCPRTVTAEPPAPVSLLRGAPAPYAGVLMPNEIAREAFVCMDACDEEIGAAYVGADRAVAACLDEKAAQQRACDLRTQAIIDALTKEPPASPWWTSKPAVAIYAGAAGVAAGAAAVLLLRATGRID